MALLDISGFTKGASKLGTAVITTVQPVANLIEMATESSNAWTQDHSANIQAKSERNAAVRQQTNIDLLRKAKASCQQLTLDTNAYVRTVQTAVALDALKGRVHEAKQANILAVSSEAIQSLVTKDNLTDNDIMRIAKVGAVAEPVTDDTSDEFNINSFTTK